MEKDKNHRVKGRLKQSNSKLNWILEITNAINNNSSKDTLFEILRNLLTKELHIGKFVLFTFHDNWQVSMKENINPKEAKVNFDSLVEEFTNIQVLSSHKNPSLSHFDVIIPAFHKKKPLAFLLLADFDGEKIEVSPIIKHLRFIQTLVNIIAVALENKRLNKEYIKQIAIKKELETAQKMQSLLFPKKLPKNAKMKVMAFYLPHSEVGGDYYDLIEMPNGNTAICVADVSGKGVSAAILMANFQAQLRALLTICEQVEEVVKQCNQKVIESANFEKFITLYLAIYNPKERVLHSINAGHPPAIYSDKNGTQLLKKGCTVLGMFEELPFIESENISIQGDGKLFCFSDGFSEMEDKKGICFEEADLSQIIQEEPSSKKIHRKFESKISEVNKKTGLTDDITYLLIDFPA